jgi:spore maturation protein CgeB
MSEEKECPSCREKAESNRTELTKVSKEAENYCKKNKVKTGVYATETGYKFCEYTQWKEHGVKHFRAVFIP